MSVRTGLVAAAATAVALSVLSPGQSYGDAQQARHRAPHPTVSASFPGSPWRVGERVHVVAKVHHGQGRRHVALQRRSHGHWHALAEAKTSKAGRARIGWRATPAGSFRFRVHLSPSGRLPGANSAVVRRKVVGDFLSVKAPSAVGEGSTFTVQFTVTGRGQALHGATLRVTAPRAGSQVRPPDTPTISSKTHQGTVRIGTVRRGRKRTVKVRWRTPTSRATLHFTGRLTAAGVKQTVKAAVVVAPPLAGSFHFDPKLTFATEAMGSPTRTTGGDLYADCTARLGSQSVKSFSATLDAIDAVTEPGTSTAAWKKLDLGARPQDADDVATISLAVGQPMAALAAAVAGYRGSQGVDETNYLNIAAAAANQAGHPGWAIALERKAAVLPQNGAVGANVKAVRLTNLGHAYALMGDWSTAQLWLDQAVSADAASPQVAKEAFAVDYCAGDKKTALKEFHTSVRPDATKDEVDNNDGVPASVAYPTYINASRLMDISHGVQVGSFEFPPVPNSIAELNQASDLNHWQQLATNAQEEADSLSHQMDQAEAAVEAERLQPAEQTRLRALMKEYARGGGMALGGEDTIIDAERKTQQVHVWTSNSSCDGRYLDYRWCSALTGTTQVPCSESDAVFTAWKGQMHAYVDDLADELKVGWPVWTGVEANIADQHARDYFDLARQLEYWLDVEDIYQTYSLSQGMNDCGGGTPPSSTQPKAPDAAAAGCGSVANRLALSVDGETEASESDLPVGFSAKVSCQQLDFEVDLNALPFLSGFLDISTTPAGGVTVMVGSKGQVGLGPFQGSFSSAFYLTVGDGKKILDLGIDVGPDAEASAAGVHIQAYSDHIHMSAISVFADPNKYY